MRPRVRIQNGQIEVGRFVQVAAILCSQRDVPREGVVGATAEQDRSIAYAKELLLGVGMKAANGIRFARLPSSCTPQSRHLVAPEQARSCP